MQRKFLLVLSVVALLIPNAAVFAQAQNGYTTFHDPNGMFSMQVPQGWYCDGRSYIDKTTGVACYYVDVANPEKSMIIAMGDPAVKPVYNTYVSGKQIAEWYYQNFIASRLQGVRMVTDDDLQDGSGRVRYTFGDNAGQIYAKTAPMGGNMWGISMLYNAVAPSSDLEQVVSIAERMVNTNVWSGPSPINPSPIRQLPSSSANQYSRTVIDQVVEEQQMKDYYLNRAEREREGWS